MAANRLKSINRSTAEKDQKPTNQCCESSRFHHHHFKDETKKSAYCLVWNLKYIDRNSCGVKTSFVVDKNNSHDVRTS